MIKLSCSVILKCTKRIRHTNSSVDFFQKRSLALAYNIIQKGETTNPPLVIIHGLLGNKFNFNNVGKLLGKKLQNRMLIACDVRNHGESPHSEVMDYNSMCEDTIELLNTLEIDKCILLGHSMGGRIAMYTALTQSNRVDKLVVVDVSPGTNVENLQLQRGINKGPVKYMEAMKLVKFEPGMKRSEARTSAHKQLENAIPEKSVRDFVLTNLIETSKGSFGWRVGLDSILQHMKDIHNLGNEGSFIPYPGKALFLGGALSDYILPSDHSEIKRLFPNSIIKFIPECGHWVHADNPKQFAKEVSEFIVPLE